MPQEDILREAEKKYFDEERSNTSINGGLLIRSPLIR